MADSQNAQMRQIHLPEVRGKEKEGWKNEKAWKKKCPSWMTVTSQEGRKQKYSRILYTEKGDLTMAAYKDLFEHIGRLYMDKLELSEREERWHTIAEKECQETEKAKLSNYELQQQIDEMKFYTTNLEQQIGEMKTELSNKESIIAGYEQAGMDAEQPEGEDW